MREEDGGKGVTKSKSESMKVSLEIRWKGKMERRDLFRGDVQKGGGLEGDGRDWGWMDRVL